MCKHLKFVSNKLVSLSVPFIIVLYLTMNFERISLNKSFFTNRKKELLFRLISQYKFKKNKKKLEIGYWILYLIYFFNYFIFFIFFYLFPFFCAGTCTGTRYPVHQNTPFISTNKNNPHQNLS